MASPPGNVRFMPVHEGSFLFTHSTRFGFSAFAVALGSSYFQRLIDAIPQVRARPTCGNRPAGVGRQGTAVAGRFWVRQSEAQGG